MASRNWAWVVLKREGVEGDEVATQVFCPGGRSFNVDALKDAAKAKFGQGLAHVDASQLSVSLSADRDGAASVARQSTLVETLGRGSTEEQPLFIHAPAAPPQGRRTYRLGRFVSCLYCVASIYAFFTHFQKWSFLHDAFLLIFIGYPCRSE
mmetsp:Transcript_25801/g.59794  ORF Transcript_25801/g.59794 Transcript_25801/m.59794 type:complete len:152 (+) Transcript_25801:316-771(+)